MIETLREIVHRQREALQVLFDAPLRALSRRAMRVWFNQQRLDLVMSEGIGELPHCDLIYAIDMSGVQVSSNIHRHSTGTCAYGQDLSRRPYLITMPLLTNTAFQGTFLCDVYISQVTRRPCLTVMCGVTSGTNTLGFIAADFDLRDLPSLQLTIDTPPDWRQIRGDPAIRGGLFAQERVPSPLDYQVDTVISILEELICERGIYHAKIHYSSSRATLWQFDDPYNYRVHVLDEITNPAICLAYSKRPYPERARVPHEFVRLVFSSFSTLRFADETIYLRSGSLNIINGMVGLNFSCDGTHYLSAAEFLDQGEDFWFSGSACEMQPPLANY